MTKKSLVKAIFGNSCEIWCHLLILISPFRYFCGFRRKLNDTFGVNFRVSDGPPYVKWLSVFPGTIKKYISRLLSVRTSLTMREPNLSVFLCETAFENGQNWKRLWLMTNHAQNLDLRLHASQDVTDWYRSYFTKVKKWRIICDVRPVRSLLYRHLASWVIFSHIVSLTENIREATKWERRQDEDTRLNWCRIVWRQIFVSFSEYWLNDCVICVFALSSFSFRNLSNISDFSIWPHTTYKENHTNQISADWSSPTYVLAYLLRGNDLIH